MDAGGAFIQLGDRYGVNRSTATLQDVTLDRRALPVSAGYVPACVIAPSLITGPAHDSSYTPISYDISSHMSDNTVVRFRTSNTLGASERLMLTFIEIEFLH